ncbi:MAG: tyrosine-type recombinase/integrase [Planctomycetes bacterium]|nr:tyrosine-type recombinase/integrase [Planctomycetota bacterium]
MFDSTALNSAASAAELRLVKAKRRAGTRRSRHEHPGVSIVSQRRRGELRIALRYRDPSDGHLRQCERIDENGAPRPFLIDEPRHEFVPIQSREAARPLARRLSEWLWKQRALLKLHKNGIKFELPPEDAEGARTQISWAELAQRHVAHLEARGRAKATVRHYEYAWSFFMRWPARPQWPSQLHEGLLEEFQVFFRKHRSKSGSEHANATYRTICQHLKGRLNFGRKLHRRESRLALPRKCVMIDGESINDGLAQNRPQRTLPVALNAAQLKAILSSALEHDAGIAERREDWDKSRVKRGLEELYRLDSSVFPVLAFLMLTGCRRGEAEQLRWSPTAPGAAESWVDLDHGRVVIHASKTGVQRTIPLSSRPLLSRLLKVRRAGKQEYEPYVFGGPLPLAIGDARRISSGALRGLSLKKAIQDVRARSGVRFRIKDLRSSLATWLAHSQICTNLFELAAQMGHDYAVLVKHYASRDFSLPKESAAAQSVENLLGVEAQIRTWLSIHEPVANVAAPKIEQGWTNEYS